jgi:hypothetical protein
MQEIATEDNTRTLGPKASVTLVKLFECKSLETKNLKGLD